MLAFRSDRARHLLQWRLARLRHLQPVSAAAGRRVRAAGAAYGTHGHDSAQRRVRGRARDRLYRRPPYRRAVYFGDGFLKLAITTCAISAQASKDGGPNLRAVALRGSPKRASTSG